MGRVAWGSCSRASLDITIRMAINVIIKGFLNQQSHFSVSPQPWKFLKCFLSILPELLFRCSLGLYICCSFLIWNISIKFCLRGLLELIASPQGLMFAIAMRVILKTLEKLFKIGKMAQTGCCTCFAVLAQLSSLVVHHITCACVGLSWAQLPIPCALCSLEPMGYSCASVLAIQICSQVLLSAKSRALVRS